MTYMFRKKWLFISNTTYSRGWSRDVIYLWSKKPILGKVLLNGNKPDLSIWNKYAKRIEDKQV